MPLIDYIPVVLIGIMDEEHRAMFNMTKIRATNGSGKSFYANHLSSNDYYSEHEKVQGYWRGELADAFGLRDKVVTSEEFSLFQRNVNPKTLDRLTQKNMPGGPRFFDFQVAAPKSVSVMSMFDERLIEAHRESVRIAMAELERLAAVRVRDGENVRTNNYETTGKLVYAEFMHDTSRALDPQLHTHNVVCNVTRTRWRQGAVNWVTKRSKHGTGKVTSSGTIWHAFRLM